MKSKERGSKSVGIQAKFAGYLVEAELGCVVDGLVVWLRKGDMDLFVGVREL